MHRAGRLAGGACRLTLAASVLTCSCRALTPPEEPRPLAVALLQSPTPSLVLGERSMRDGRQRADAALLRSPSEWLAGAGRGIQEASQFLGSRGGRGDARAPDRESELNATTTTRPTIAQVVSDQLGIETNSSDDTARLGVSLAVNVLAIAGILLGFCCIWRVYPLVYSHRSAENEALPQPQDSLVGWFWASFTVTEEQTTDVAGLDVTMFIEFCNFGMYITAALGLPMCVVMCPVYLYYGGLESDDLVTRLSINNVKKESNVYGLVALLVWVVVIAVYRMIWAAQEKFIPRRIAWLKAMPEPRATTLLVQDIPRQYCTDTGLQEYYERLFPGAVQRVYVAKNIGKLAKRVEQWKSADQSLHEAIHEWDSRGQDPNNRPYMLEPLSNRKIDRIDFHTKAKIEAEAQMRTERDQVQRSMDASEPSLFASEGFVTFKTRRDAEIARQLQLEHEGHRFKMSYAPDPDDVRYNDLLLDSQQQKFLTIIGYGCIIGVFFAFLPVITILASFTNLSTLESIAVIDWLLTKMPLLVDFLEGTLSSLALTIVMGFLPGIFQMISLQFFSLKAKAWSQVYLQNWYFNFLVLFVILITAIGSSLWASLTEIITEPTTIFQTVAEALPSTSNFYMDYTVLQYTTTALQLLRIAPWLKFTSISLVCEKERAKELSEPEDQDYNGMGARSARVTLMLVTGLIFSTVIPLILPLTFTFFFISRSTYGYLMVFAETKKADSGGVFWCQALRHIQNSMVIYVVMMSGICYLNASTMYPFWISLSSIVYMFTARMSFEYELLWECLPFRRVMEAMGEDATVSTQGAYFQKELEDSTQGSKNPN